MSSIGENHNLRPPLNGPSLNNGGGMLSQTMSKPCIDQTTLTLRPCNKHQQDICINQPVNNTSFHKQQSLIEQIVNITESIQSIAVPFLRQKFVLNTLNSINICKTPPHLHASNNI